MDKKCKLRISFFCICDVFIFERFGLIVRGGEGLGLGFRSEGRALKFVIEALGVVFF